MAAAVNKTSTLHHFDLKNATVRDETRQKVTVVFRELDLHTAKPCYEILVDDKKIVFPTALPPYTSRIKFFDKHSFSFIPVKDDFIKITIKNTQQETTYYVNSKKCVSGNYVVYKYVPKPITLEEAKQKLQSLSKFPEFHPQLMLHNCHGVAAFGVEGDEYALYWANPDEENCNKLELERCKHALINDKLFVTSADGSLILEGDWTNGYSLNGEPAQILSE